VATTIVIGLLAVAAVSLVFFLILSHRRAAREAAGEDGDAGRLPLAGPDPGSLLGDRADRQAAAEQLARRRRGLE
jgi:hypothetical protein